MVSVRVSSKLEPSWDFFSQRIEWRPKKIVLILRILENAVSSEKKKQKKNKQTKKPQEFFESLSKNTWKYMKLKYLDLLRRETNIFPLWSRRHSPIDNCSLFIQHKEQYIDLARAKKEAPNSKFII